LSRPGPNYLSKKL